MPVRIKSVCPSCNKSLKVSERLIGKAVRCSACQHWFVISAVSSVGDQSIEPSMEAVQTLTSHVGDTDVSYRRALRPSVAKAEPVLGRIGRFQLRDVLGQGGFGKVYRAYDPTLDRQIALKVPKFEAHEALKIKRFLAEGKAAARLHHPNIVAVYETGELNGQYYIASEYVDGVPLSVKLKEERPNYTRSVVVIRALADALQYAHDEGVIHRDIKPANIMIASTGRPQIMDFGLAKRLDEDSTMTSDGSVLGTPAYMAPEQARGDTKEIGPASDQYSLGVVMYELLTGRRPFDGQPQLVLHKVITEQPPAPRSVVRGIPQDLEAICQKAMQKSPLHRYDSLSEMSDDLVSYLHGRPITARPVGSLDRLYRWCRRESLSAALVAAVLAILAIGMGVSTWQWRRAEANAAQANENARQAYTREVDALEAQRLAVAERQEVERQRQNVEEQRQKAEEQTRLAITARNDVFRHYYTAQMNLAQRDWESTHIGSLLDRLEATRPERTGGQDLRGFEWYYWNRCCNSELLTIKGHTRPVRSVACSPDGTRIVSGSYDNTLKVWDVATGEEKLTLKGHTHHVWSVAFSPDGARIVSGSYDNTLKVWNVATGEEMLTLKGHTGAVDCVAFHPDGTRIVSGGSDQTLKIWDAGTGQEIFTLKGQTGRVSCVAFSPDGTRIVSGGGKVWDAGTGQEIFTLKGHTHHVSSVAFSPDGARIVSGSDDQTLKIWDAGTGQEIFTLKGHTEEVNCVAFHPDGTRIVSGGSDQTLKIWDASTGQEILTLKGHTHHVSSVAFSPDGARIVSGSYDNTLKVWDADNSQETRTLQGYACGSVAFSPDGARIVSGSDDQTLKIWDASTGQEILTLKGHTGHFSSVAFSSDGARIVSGSDDQTLKIWDAGTGQEIFTLKGHTGHVSSVAFSPDGARIVSGSFDQTLKIWDAGIGKVTLTLKGHTSIVNSAAFSPDGTRIVSGSFDNTVKDWDAVTGQETRTLMGHGSSSVAFSPDGERIVSGGGNTLEVWGATGRQVLTLNGHTDHVRSVAFSPDGTRIVSGSQDKTLKLWDAVTGQETLTLKGHTGTVNSAAFSPDGTRIVSGSQDGTLKIWDATVGTSREASNPGVKQPTHAAPRSQTNRVSPAATAPVAPAANAAAIQPHATLTGHRSRVEKLAFSNDANSLASGHDDGTIQVWNVSGNTETATFKGHTDAVRSLAYSPDGSLLASAARGDNAIRLWDSRSGKPIGVLPAADLDEIPESESEVTCLAFSPDGSILASGHMSNVGLKNNIGILTWDVRTMRRSKTLRVSGFGISAVAFSKDGTTLAGGCHDTTIKLWKVSTGQERATLGEEGHFAHQAMALAIAPDGQTLTSICSQGIVKLWQASRLLNMKPKEALATFSDGSNNAVSDLALSPDGSLLASTFPKEVTLWDIKTQQKKGICSGSASELCFSQDGALLAGGQSIGRILLWDLSKLTTGSSQSP